MPKFKGIIVGGPLAGQYYECLSKHFNACEAEGNCMSISDALSSRPRIATTTYIHHSLDVDDQEIGFWIPVGGTVAWALREIIETYANYEDMK